MYIRAALGASVWWSLWRRTTSNFCSDWWFPIFWCMRRQRSTAVSIPLHWPISHSSVPKWWWWRRVAPIWWRWPSSAIRGKRPTPTKRRQTSHRWSIWRPFRWSISSHGWSPPRRGGRSWSVAIRRSGPHFHRRSSLERRPLSLVHCNWRSGGTNTWWLWRPVRYWNIRRLWSAFLCHRWWDLPVDILIWWRQLRRRSHVFPFRAWNRRQRWPLNLCERNIYGRPATFPALFAWSLHQAILFWLLPLYISLWFFRRHGRRAPWDGAVLLNGQICGFFRSWGNIFILSL